MVGREAGWRVGTHSGSASFVRDINSMVEERHRYRSIILFGMPGSGKGTQGAVLGQLPSFVHISMGDVFRKIPRTGKFGREIEQYTSQGLMVPDDLTVRIFERHLNILEMQELVMPEQHTLILDGLPRSYAQAERLDRIHRRDPDLPPQDRRHGHGRSSGCGRGPCARTGSTT